MKNEIEVSITVCAVQVVSMYKKYLYKIPPLPPLTPPSPFPSLLS